MNTDDRFDDALRAAHARSLEHLSPRVQAQLRQRRRSALAGDSATAPRPWRFAWPLAAACALGAVAVSLQFRTPDAPTPPAVVATTAPASTVEETAEYATLDESPQLYVWLASDGAALAME
jgi:hypothetical protein